MKFTIEFLLKNSELNARIVQQNVYKFSERIVECVLNFKSPH